jgi:hypothetical protein
LTEKHPDNSEGEAWARVAVEVATELRPALLMLRQLGLAHGPPGVLSMPVVRGAN